MSGQPTAQAKRAIRKIYGALLAAIEALPTPDLEAAHQALSNDDLSTLPDSVQRTRFTTAYLAELVGRARADWTAADAPPPATPAVVGQARGAAGERLQAAGTMPASAWVPHKAGDPCPVEPSTLVEVEFRVGRVELSCPARMWAWRVSDDDPHDGDIVRWRLGERLAEPVPGTTWTTWPGGRAAPVPRDTRVELRLRSGRRTNVQAARNWRWHWESPPDPNDAVMWRLA